MPCYLDPLTQVLLKNAGKATITQGRGPVILVYHGTSLGRGQPFSKYSISAKRFKEHISFLDDYGWHTRCVRDLLNPESLPKKTVILTFDDGYYNNFDGAFLPLIKFNMKATWFITSNIIDSYANWLGTKNPETRILTATQIKEMEHYGMEIASHTCSHPHLVTLSLEDQSVEMQQSKNKLESIINDSISSFAYPYGVYDQSSLQALIDCGYSHACTVQPGWVGGGGFKKYELRRVTIFANDNVRTFARKLVFADNDVTWPRVYKYFVSRAAARLGKN